MRLRQVDLNLLNVFDAVMRHRSVSTAAEQLALSPSAVSHALGRLRLALKDELFIRDERGMTPTARALELSGSVRDGLALLERALSAAPFVPAESIRGFRIAAGDYGCAFILPALLRRLARTAPAINLRMMPVNRTDIGRQLATGAVDLVIGWFEILPKELRRRPLLREGGVLVVRAGHPLTESALSRDELFSFPHAVVEMTGEDDVRSDGFHDDRGLVRRVWMERVMLQARSDRDMAARVAVSVPHFTALPFLLRETDLVATLPVRLAKQAVAAGGLVMLDPALEPNVVDIEMVWHARSDTDAGLAWLAEELAAACAALEDEAPTA
jgi:DNA-binding transcriptional LysR family regulator